MAKKIVFHESFGPVSPSLMTAITRFNVSPSDWDMMLMRWGYQWGDGGLPFSAIENHIISHSQMGYYQYPMYEDD